MIRFEGVSKSYPGATRPALGDVTLDIAKGEFVFLIGASGSGKTTMLRLILKEGTPDSGQITVLGKRLSALRSREVPYFRRHLGVVFQDFRLLPNKSVYDNVAFALRVTGASRGLIQEAVPEALRMVGLAGKSSRMPHELSGGEQQRVAIARAVVNKPAILLADEPTGNLDWENTQGVMSVLERINRGGTTVVMATHAVDIVDRMQRRVVELMSGRIIRDERGSGYVTQAIPTHDGDIDSGTARPTAGAPA
jgi:cell division transport system ATP-binding protein